MKKAVLILFLMLTMLYSFAAATDGGNVTNTGTNFTIYFANTGTFQFLYTGYKNITFNETQNWINVTNGTDSVLYNISSGESWALYQDPTMCVMPYENMLPTISYTKICGLGSTYHFTDPTGNGTIIAGGNSIIIDGNGAIFIGNNTASSVGIGRRALYFNVTIKNFIIKNYATAINYFSGNNWTIRDNRFFNNSANAIYLRNSANASIFNNYINETQNRTGSHAIFLDLVGRNNLIINNTIYGYDDGIRTDNNVDFSTIQGNFIYNVGNDGIYIKQNCTNALVDSNYVFGSKHNNYVVATDNSNTTNNIGLNASHHCLDYNADVTDGNARIENGLVENNYCDLYNNTLVRYLYLYNTTNFIVRNNNYTGIVDGEIDVVFNSGNNSGNQLYNNLNLNGKSRYDLAYFTNTTINETSSNLFLNITGNRNVNFTFMGRKDIAINTYSITFNSLTPPYNEIMNRSNNRVIAVGVSSYTITLGAGEQIEVGDFTYCGDGIFQYLDDELIAEDCDGVDYNGETCLSLGYPKGTLSCDASCNYVLTDCQAKSVLCQNNIVPLTGMTAWIGLIVTILFIAFVFILFTNQNINIKLEGDVLFNAVAVLISVGVLIGIGLIILINLC